MRRKTRVAPGWCYLVLLFGCAAAAHPVRGQTPEPLRLVTPEGHTGSVTSAGFSHDGRWVVTASKDRTARVWEVATGREVMLLRGHTKGVTAAAFSPDDQWVVTASLDDTARVWDVTKGRVIAVFAGHTAAVNAAAFSPDGHQVVTASNDGTARVWEPATGREVAAFRGHKGPVNSAAFSPDGRRVVTAGNDSTARVWDVATRGSAGGASAVIREHDPVNSAAFSPNGRWVATVSGKIAQVWNVAMRRQVVVFRRHAGLVTSVAFSPDGRRVVTASYDSTARVWVAATGQQVIRSLRGHAHSVLSASFSPDGRKVVTASGDQTARVWEAATGGTLALLGGHTNRVTSAALSPDGRWGVTANGDKTARVWDNAGHEVAVLPGHTDCALSAAFSPDGEKVVTVSVDNTARVWQVTTGREVAVLRGHTAWVNSAAFSRDGRLLVTASGDRTARVWEAATGRELQVLRGPGNGVVMCAAFSPDGQWVVTAGLDGTARVWDVTKGRAVAVLGGHTAIVNSAAFSPDGRWVVTASGDNTARVWDVGTESTVAVFRGHSAEVRSAAFSPDGTRVVTASLDETARVWEAATGREMMVLGGFASGVRSAAFSRDGRLIITGSDDSARLWDARTGAELLRRFSFDSSDWAAVAPDGRYDGSQPGFGRLHYALGLQTIPVTTFLEKFYVPELTEAILSGAPYTGPDLRHGFGLPPAVRIVSPRSGDTVSATVTVTVEVRDQGGGVEEPRLFDNGTRVGGATRSGVAREKCPEGKTADSTTAVCFTVELLPGSDTLEATAFSVGRAEAERARVIVDVRGGSASESAKPTSILYLLAVGINHYQNSRYDLNYARADAAAFADSLRIGAKDLFAKVVPDTLFDQAATGLAIKTAFVGIIKKARPEDTFVFYYAGHGTVPVQDTTYYLVPSDVTQMNDVSQLAQQALSNTQLRALFDAVQARKRLMLVDACHAGAIVEAYGSRGPVEARALTELANASGFLIVTATEKHQLASEVEKLGHGVFTYALLQAMSQPPRRKRMVVAIVNETEQLMRTLTTKYHGAEERPEIHLNGQNWPLIMR